MAEVLATYVLGTDTISTIEAGVQNENDASCVKFDYSDWKEEYGDGILSMRIQRREDDDPYPVLLTVSTDPDDGENVMVWSISDVDTAQIGKHKAQLTYTVDGVRKKTTVFLYRIVRSVVSGDTVPDPYDDWLEDLESMASDMLDDGAAIVNEAKGYRNEASGYATAASGSATSASNSASDSEAYAKGTRGGTAIDSDDPAYHKNSKYYSEQAATSASNASDSASTANTAKESASDYAEQAYLSSESASRYASNASSSATDASGFATNSAGHSQNSEAWAKGTRGGTAVGSDDPAYHNNSKYFSEQASASATAAAGSATAAAASVSSLAPAYSSSATYDVGDYVLYSGSLYRCTTEITTAEEWTAAHWTAAKLAEDVSDVKSDFDYFVSNEIILSQATNITDFVQGYVRDDGTLGSSTTRCRTRFVSFDDNTTVISAKTGYKIRVSEYAAQNAGTWVGFVKSNTPLDSIEFSVTHGHYYVIEVRNNSDTTLSPSDLPSDVASYTYRYYTDTTLEVAGKAADSKAVGDKIAEEKTIINQSINAVKSDVSILDSLTTSLSTEYFLYNILSQVSFSDGSVNKDGSSTTSSSYKHTTKIPVREGDSIRVGDITHQMRVVAAYSGNNAISAKGAEYQIAYTVPEGIDGVILTFANADVPASELFKNTKDIIPNLSEYWYSTNLLNLDALTENKACNKNGAIANSGSYSFTDYISVSPGDVVKGFYSDEIRADNLDSFRVVTAYDINKTPVTASGAEEVAGYTVPEGIKNVRITIYNSRLANDSYRIVIDRYYPFEPYKKELLPVGAGENQLNTFNLINRPLTTLPEYITNSLAYRPVGKLSKPYICLTTDDGAHELATYVIPMLITKQVPCTFYLMRKSEVFTDASETETVVDSINNSGMELGQHGERSWLNTDELALRNFFDAEDAFFNTLGLSAKSAACPGGYSTPMIDALAGGRYGAHCNGYGDTEIMYYPNYCIGPRSNLYGLTRVGVIDFTLAEHKTFIDYAIAHNLIYCVYWHDNRFTPEDTGNKAILEGLIDYAKSQNVDFCTVGDIATLTQTE